MESKKYMAEEFLKIRGARQHNLKNINLDIPKNKLVCFTGVSGSGKSSLAFDTIYAEGQRRYVESLSTYARQFLGLMEKPDVDLIEGLSPAISIDQKTTSKNPRSTVGTITEIYDYLRLLFARVGHPHCPVCGREIRSQSLDEIKNSVFDLIKNEGKHKNLLRLMVLSPVVVDKKGEFTDLFLNLKTKGYKFARIDKQIKDLGEDFLLIKTNKHTIEAVIDKISFMTKNLKDPIYLKNLESRILDSISQSLKLSDGLVIISEILDKSLEMPQNPKLFHDFLFSEKFSCPVDNIQIPEIEPRTFSFNSPHGACSECSGLGKILKVNPDILFSNEISIKEGGVLPFSNIFEHDTWYARLIQTVCMTNKIDLQLPIKLLSDEGRKMLLYGSGDREYRVEGNNRFGRSTVIYEVFEGFVKELERRHRETESDWVRAEVEKYMTEYVCEGCNGGRLKKESLSITIDGKSIVDVTRLSIEDCLIFIKILGGSTTPLSSKEIFIAGLIIKEIENRLNFLISVGLDYLSLDRSSATLAGGEAQRIRLASQIGSGLTGVLYVLDEPTIGLHPRDNQRLIQTLKKLRDLGNTVIIVEHDEETMRASDMIIDFGVGAGKEGGYVVASGTVSDIETSDKSITGKFLKGERVIALDFVNQPKLEEGERNLLIHNCNLYNLKNISAKFPLGKLVVVTGVSGSGKSTLLVETLYRALINELQKKNVGQPIGYDFIEGIENIDKVVLIDQSAIGKTPRSNPATYTKTFDFIRDVFARMKESKIEGFKKGRFSFNVKGGRCEACEGQGQTKIEMQFMSDIWIPCEVCKGTRYNSLTLSVIFKGKNISEVLGLTVSEALEYFHGFSQIFSKLKTLEEVGLGYIELGQPATTLSGGEAQRVKLATELSKRDTGRTVYILDEPTTGLHFADVEKLLKVLSLLVRKGNSVFVIEHNLDVIKNADWIIDLGPDGGEGGGEIVFQGTISDIYGKSKSHTGYFLSKLQQ